MICGAWNGGSPVKEQASAATAADQAPGVTDSRPPIVYEILRRSFGMLPETVDQIGDEDLTSMLDKIMYHA